MQSGADNLQFRVPQQHLRKLSFCGHTPKKLEAWVEALPMVNVGESARLLYSAIQELNQLEIDALHRYELLEILRTPIHYICKSLAKHYLNQSIVLPTKASKVASLAQALQNHMSIGYQVVIVQSLAKIKDQEFASVIAHSIHRALTDLSMTLLRCYQLYFPTPANLWRDLHRLFLLAEHYRLLSYEITDRANIKIPGSAIHHAYMRSLLIATAKPNQLRQNEIELVYKAAEVWSMIAKIHSQLDEFHLFVANLASDAEPVYSSLIVNKEKNPYYRYFECHDLATQLQEFLDTPDHFVDNKSASFYVPRGFDDDLLKHLIQSWGRLLQRSFSRTQNKGLISICLGLSATHYYLADKQEFEILLRSPESTERTESSSNPFLKGPNDVWSFAIDAGTNAAIFTPDPKGNGSINYSEGANANAVEPPKFDTFECDLLNTSPGGFCIAWGDKVPTQVKTGEIIGVRENNQKSWSIGVIRWVKQFKSDGARMGIELLAPNAEPIGARVINKTGTTSEYMRVLVLPELKAIGQAATLITPKIAFHVGNKIVLNVKGLEEKAQLTKQVSSTASFSQFQFKYFNQTQSEAAKPNSASPLSKDDDFDSIWSSL